jgi:hypothetical protein
MFVDRVLAANTNYVLALWLVDELAMYMWGGLDVAVY